jgi:ferredoxin-NADP reductase
MFNPVQIIDKVQESQTIWSFYLKPTDGRPLTQYQPGQHIVVRLDVPGQAGPILRSYTLSGASGKDYYRITVKREGTLSQPGLASSFLHDDVQPGDTILISEPQGRFVLLKDSRRPVVLLSAGVGITPMVSMLETIAQESGPRNVWFFHGSRNAEHQPMGECLRKLAREHSNIQLFIHHSQPSETEQIGLEYDGIGRIDLDFIKQVLPGYDVDFYLCGPRSFVEILSAGLKSWGVQDSQIAFSYFTAVESNNLSDQNSDLISIEPKQGFAIKKVTLTRSAKSFIWDETCGSLLDLLEKHDIFPPSSCREGTCMSCSTSMTSGTVSYEPEPFGEPFEGEILLCCARPETDIELDL